MLIIAWGGSLFFIAPLALRMIGTWRAFDLSASWAWLVYAALVLITLAFAHRALDNTRSVFWSAANIMIAIGYPFLLILGR